MARIDVAVRALKVAPRPDCWADGSITTVAITTPSGTRSWRERGSDCVPAVPESLTGGEELYRLLRAIWRSAS